MFQAKTIFRAKEKMIYCGIAEHKFIVYAYTIYAYFKGIKIVFFGENKYYLLNIFKKNIEFLNDNIMSYNDEWYNIQKHIVQNSNYLEKMRLDNILLIKLQKRIFKSNKVINFYKQRMSDLEYKFLRDRALVKQYKDDYIFLFPKLISYRTLAKCYMNDNQYKLSVLLSLMFYIFGITVAIKSIMSGLLLIPTIKSKVVGKVLKNLAWGFGKNDFSDDMLVDGKKFFNTDMVYYIQKKTIKKYAQSSLEEAKRKNLKTIELTNKINLNRCYYKNLKNNVFFGIISIIVILCRSPFLFFSFCDFNNRSIFSYKLYSFSNVKYHWSMGNWHDIVETIIANLFGIRMFLYSWSDYAQSYLYPTIFTVHNDLFLWGPIQEKFMFPKSLHDNVYCIGCLFSNSIQNSQKNGNDILNSFNLKKEKPVVVFYDSPRNDAVRFSKNQVIDFWELVKEIKANKSEVQVVLKPKTITQEYLNYFQNTGVTLLDSKNSSLRDIIKIATLNVGMGFVAPVSVALTMDKQGIFYDTGYNFQSPFAKYEGEIVFRNKKKLLVKIEQILMGKSKKVKIDEIKDYNVKGADPVEILRNYVTTGKMDEKYLLK